MEKTEFITEFQDLLASMSEEEIEKTLEALHGCKTLISQKDNQEKGEKARLFSTVERNEAELRYEHCKKKRGTIRTVGASLLTVSDFYDAKNAGYLRPLNNDSWWLYNTKRLISNNQGEWNCDPKNTARIRPVIVIERIDGNLKPGETFYINDEAFVLLSPFLMIRKRCLSDYCTYNAVNYECSLLKLCVDGWYARLVRENKKAENADDLNSCADG